MGALGGVEGCSQHTAATPRHLWQNGSIFILQRQKLNDLLLHTDGGGVVPVMEASLFLRGHNVMSRLVKRADLTLARGIHV